MPSLDEMKAVAKEVAETLRRNGDFNEVEVMDFESGADIPIAFETQNENFVLELNVL
jgi:hypothetical protein